MVPCRTSHSRKGRTEIFNPIKLRSQHERKNQKRKMVEEKTSNTFISHDLSLIKIYRRSNEWMWFKLTYHSCFFNELPIKNVNVNETIMTKAANRKWKYRKREKFLYFIFWRIYLSRGISTLSYIMVDNFRLACWECEESTSGKDSW